MASLPKAVTRVQETAGVPVGGLDTICVICPVATNADTTPRYFGSAQAIYDQHGYSEGLEYAALHINETGNSVLFVGVPIATQGTLSRRNNDGHTGTAGITVTAGANGPLAEHDGVIDVVKGGTVGVDQIVLGLSLDGGRVFQMLRVGTANSVAIPFLEVTIGLLAGTLVEGDTVFSWHGSAPTSDAAGRDLARVRLSEQQKPFRTIMLCGDLVDHADAQLLLDLVNTYETLNERFTFARGSIADRLPLPVSSSVRKLSPASATRTLTFNAAAHTITASSGSFLTDGIAIGDAIYSNTPLNSGYLGIASNVTATVITFAAGLVNEGPLSAGLITARNALVFAATTITRNAGSWTAEGFKIGQTIATTGTVSNNGSKVLTGVSATVLTYASGGVAETIGIGLGVVTQSLTKAAWMAAQDLEYSSITNAPRISLSAGRARKVSPFSQWNFRRPAAWSTSIREYQHDIHVASVAQRLRPALGLGLDRRSGQSRRVG
jgi:hypothetical protein